MTTITKPVSDSEIIQLTNRVKSAVVELKRSAEDYAGLIDRDPGTVDRLQRLDPTITAEYLYRLEMLGRGKINEKFITLSNNRLSYILRLRPGIQNEVAEKPVRLLIGENGHTETIEVDIINATPDQLGQLITSDGRIRSEAEQRALKESRREKLNRSVRAPRQPVEIVRDELVINEAGTRLKAADLLRYAAKLAEAK